MSLAERIGWVVVIVGYILHVIGAMFMMTNIIIQDDPTAYVWWARPATYGALAVITMGLFLVTRVHRLSAWSCLLGFLWLPGLYKFHTILNEAKNQKSALSGTHET